MDETRTHEDLAAGTASARVTTTHAAPGAGSPRLVRRPGGPAPEDLQLEYPLTRDETSIGSDPACDVVLPGLRERHALVVHDRDDEYHVVSLGAEVRVHGQVVEDTALLRTGARIEVGDHTLTYVRDESADHTRPYGGRAGGEIGHQPSQPPRRSS